MFRRGSDEGRLHRAGLQGLQTVYLSLCQDPQPLTVISTGEETFYRELRHFFNESYTDPLLILAIFSF